MKTIYNKLSFHKKLIIIFIALLTVSTIIIGVTAYSTAKNSLNKKGEVILKNGVTQALMLIDAEYAKYKSGVITEDEAKENVKTKLQGPLNTDGTRTLHRNIDLGEHGYFIIYDKKGTEVMHPTLEGENVWDVVDFSDEQHKLVQEQIEIGLNGGGYSYYSWHLPHSDKIGQKISYADYNENWEWIVVSTAYVIDFNSDSAVIFYALFIAILLTVSISGLIIVRYVSEVAKPILMIVDGMSKVTKSDYRKVNARTYGGEIDILINGYNKMLDNLKDAETNIREHQERLTYLAYHDELTSLPNRNGFKEHVSYQIDNNVTNGFIIQLDIVGLKEINSTMGFEKGDEILRFIAEYFLTTQSDHYYVSRTSSNEFCLWVENVNIKQMNILITRIRQEIKGFVISKGIQQVIELYAAVASYPEEGLVFETIFEKVAMAMKDAKESKDLRVTSYVQGMKQSIENELKMKKYLHNAIINKEIVPYYQTKINYKTNEVVGVEALSRWTSKDLGFVPPNEFIPALSRLNLMSEFTTYIFNYVLLDYKELVLKFNRTINVSINVPPSVFLEKGFYTMVKSAINKSGVPGDRVIIEITEDVFIADIEKVARIVKKLHELGVKISIDDFGTGYSSLNYLINIDFDEMKIDKSFIDEILEDDKVFKLFEILCKIAEVYGYQIVAEGVETNEQLYKIKSTSLEVIQGYLFSKPESL